MDPRVVLVAASALACTALGCAQVDEGFPASDAVPRESVAEVDPTGLTPAPIGGGYCCPIGGPLMCDCNPDGSWIAEHDVRRCPMLCHAAPPYRTIIDAHGCTVVLFGSACFPPGEPPTEPDTGAEVPTDSRDAAQEADASLEADDSDAVDSASEAEVEGSLDTTSSD